MELSVIMKIRWFGAAIRLGGILLGCLFVLAGCTKAAKEPIPPIIRSPDSRTIEKQRKAIREDNKKKGEEWIKRDKTYTF